MERLACQIQQLDQSMSLITFKTFNKDHFYLTVRNTDGGTAHASSNTLANFTVPLKDKLLLGDDWEVALVFIDFPGSRSSSDLNHLVYVHCNVVGEMVFGNDASHSGARNVLAIVDRATGYTSHQPNNPLYVPVDVDNVGEIEIKLKKHNGSVGLYNTGMTTVVLHFRRRPTPMLY